MITTDTLVETPNLESIYSELSEYIRDSVELGTYDDESKFDFCFEKYGYTVEGSGHVGGDWKDNGNDGWNDPLDYYLENGWGCIDDLEVYYTDPETGEEACFEENIISKLRSRLEEDLEDYMSDY